MFLSIFVNIAHVVLQFGYLFVVNFDFDSFAYFDLVFSDQFGFWNKTLTNIQPVDSYSKLFFRLTAQKMKFSIEDFFNKYDQIRRKLWIWSHLLKKSLMENFIFSAVSVALVLLSPGLLGRQFLIFMLFMLGFSLQISPLRLLIPLIVSTGLVILSC